jgi:transcription initiation factor TFIID subunit 2
MKCLAESLVASTASQQAFAINPDDDDLMQEDIEEQKLHKEAINELERYRRIDEWISSYQNIYSVTALECMQRLSEHGVVKNKKAEILQYTQFGNADEVRLAAWNSLVQLKLARRPQILKYLLHSLCDDPSPYFRDQLLQVLGRALGTIALKAQEAENPPPKPAETGGLVLEQEEPVAVQPLPVDLAGRSPAELALIALKAALVDDGTFKTALWHVIQAPTLAIAEVVSFLDIAALIYDASNGLTVRLRLPRYYSVKHVGKGKMLFTEKSKHRKAPTTGLGVEEYQMVQQYGLNYNGPLSRAAKDHIKLLKAQARDQSQEKQKLEIQIAAMQQEVQRQAQVKAAQGQAPPPARPSHVPSTAMSPPPLPVSTPGPMKLTLKRKQSSTAEPRATSPKRPHLSQPTNGTAATIKVEKSPSITLGKTHSQTQSRVMTGASTPASAAASRKPTSTPSASNNKPSKSRIVRLKFTKPKRLQKILSQPPQPGRTSKPKGAIPAKINTSGTTRPSPAASTIETSQARGGSNDDFFASPEVTTALSTGASVGAFRSWNGMSAVKQEPSRIDPAPMSAVSPMTIYYPGSKGNGFDGGGGEASSPLATPPISGAATAAAAQPSEGIVAVEERKPKLKIKFGKKPTA